MKEDATVKSCNIFSENLRKLLLIAPVREKVLSIDPGFRNGCKIAVLDKNGTLIQFCFWNTGTELVGLFVCLIYQLF